MSMKKYSPCCHENIRFEEENRRERDGGDSRCEERWPKERNAYEERNWPKKCNYCEHDWREDSNQREERCRYEPHVHEIVGSVEIAERRCDPHNHRFATVSGPAIPLPGGNHYHEVKFHTDSYEGHFHQFFGFTRGAVMVGDRHVHFLESTTTRADGHTHDFRVTTLIQDPIAE